MLPILRRPFWAKQYEHAISHAGTKDRADWKISNKRPVQHPGGTGPEGE